ncbi:PDZ domain-containing protein [Pseudolysobacter antarcticus]|uniref:PDZ domain-containing protein n=1 Tax=Pseudolysobacter antarcticus TaxID=2511995 RepID=A0A411HEK7_9GAMM|nr:PDZ domain-containing protein [Pseudolysobacter antarcticus]QBB68916.1 PDZ domain-containing protein [Pseudolysobacter antarcticus]
MKTNRLLLRTTLVLAICQSGVAFATTDTAATDAPALNAISAQAPPNAERALHEEMHRTLLRLAEAGALGNSPERLALDVSEPAQRSNNLGLLIDSSKATADGVHVLGITPGGSAERMGVRTGDLVTAVNSRSLQNLGVDAEQRPLAPGVLKNSVDQLKDGEPLQLAVRRDGKSLALNAPVHALYLPAMRLQLGAAALLTASAGGATEATGGCGRISQFDVAPRQQNLHRAVIISIDGKLPGPQGQDAFQVPAGQHSVEVAEAIESRYLPFNDIARTSNRRYQKLSVDVAANTTYLIAARLIPDKRTDPKAYWEPVMWKQNAETCN